MNKKAELNFNALYDLVASFEDMPESAKAISELIRLSLQNKIKNTNAISWRTMDISGKSLDYDNVYHFVDICRRLGLLNQIVKNKKFLKLVDDCYKKHKGFYAAKPLMSPEDNKWSKMLCVMSWTGLLAQHEIDFWTGKIATTPYDPNKPMFPQCWNKVWVLRLGFGIDSIDAMGVEEGGPVLLRKRYLTSYFPALGSVLSEDVFGEGLFVMLWKYRIIAKFLKIKIEQEIEKMPKYFFLR